MTGWLADPVVQGVLHGGFALLFAAAARHKWREPRAFLQALEDYALLPRRALPAAARVLPLLEAGLALALLVPGAGSLPALAGAGLLAAYGLAMAINLARGRAHIDCGCGAPGQHIAPALVARNAGLALLLVLAALPAQTRPLAPLDLFHLAAALGSAALLHLSIEQALRNQRRRRNST